MEIRRLLIEQLAQSREQSRMVVADVDAAEAREQIEITPPLLVPQIRPLRAHVNASIAEDAEQFHECRIHVAGVALGGGDHACLCVVAGGAPATTLCRAKCSAIAKVAAQPTSK